MSDQALTLARHWRHNRADARFDPQRFENLAKLVVSVERRALERRLSFMAWASGQWALQGARGRKAA